MEDNNQNKVSGIVIAVVSVVFVFIIWAAIAYSPSPGADKTRSAESGKSQVIDKVDKYIDDMDDEDRAMLASTPDGLQGNIENAKADGKNGVIVTVTTGFGSAKEDGRDIAFNIFSAMCVDIPELESLYVTSTSTGLDSRSVYKSEIPACKNL